MRPDTADLNEFYSSSLGRMAKESICRQLPGANSGERILLLGYGIDYAHCFASKDAMVFAAMPARQGAVRWPSKTGMTCRTCLVDVEDLPFLDAAFDRIVLIHCLEFSGRVGSALTEVARVLAPAGHVHAVVPNRMGLWSKRENTPFGNGRPFSQGQLTRLMEEAHLGVTHWNMALMMPPVQALSNLAQRLENMGQTIWSGLGGVHVVEARKDVFAGKRKPAPRLAADVPIRVPIFQPVPAAREIPSHASACLDDLPSR